MSQLKITKEEVAANFITVVESHISYMNKVNLPQGQLTALYNLVNIAGFDVKEIVPGKLTAPYQDSDFRESTEQTYQINDIWGLKVLDKKGKDNYRATGWLNCILKRVLDSIVELKENPGERLKAVLQEIDRSLPYTPILLSMNGDYLEENQPEFIKGKYEYFVNHLRDSHLLVHRIGVHQVCGGSLEYFPVTCHQNAIVCKKCFLRVYFVNTLLTYKDLRRMSAEHFEFHPSGV